MSEDWSRLAKKVWTTKGARFNATRRLEGQYRSSAQTLALLSIYLVVLQCWLALDGNVGTAREGWIWTVLSIGLALFILVLGLLEQNKKYQVEADRLHRSAMELNRLCDLMTADDEAGAVAAQLAERTEAYHDVLGRTTENHDEIDFHLVRTQFPDDFKTTWCERQWIRVRYWNRIYRWYVVAVIPWLILWWGVTLNQ